MFTIIALLVCATAFHAALRGDRRLVVVLGLVSALSVALLFRVHVDHILDLRSM